MSRRPTLQDFIDDELLRVPMTLDTVIDAVHDSWRQRLPRHDRVDGNPARALMLHRGELIAETLQALRESAQTELSGAAKSASAAPPAAAWRSVLPALELSLIGEDDVAVDIEIARCTQAIKQAAETELRELHTYTSALVHDLNVARDTNPFGPERFVRAFWRGVQRLPLTRPVLAAFMHQAAEPLALALRRAYASAGRRLQEQGVAPAAYRTIVFGGGTAWGADLSRYRPPEDLQQLHDSMPALLDAVAPARPATTSLPEPASGPDPQWIELLARLFAAIQTERGLAHHTVALLQRLHTIVLRLSLHDTSPLDAYDHPVWRFMDQMAFDIECSAPTQLARLLGLCRNLMDHLDALDKPEGNSFTWAIVRLAAARQHSLAQATNAAAPQIKRLQRITLDEASHATGTMPLDIGTLDTVPAELLPEPHRAPTPLGPFSLLQATTAGTHLRCHLQGQWRVLVCLWQDAHQELLLLHEPATTGLWALRQPALSRLLAENLARPMRVRSLVRRAADRVLRAM